MADRVVPGARVVIDLDFLGDLLDVGRRFALQERHQFLERLLAITLAEIDRIKQAENLERRRGPAAAIASFSRATDDLSGSDAGALIVLAQYRDSPEPD